MHDDGRSICSCIDSPSGELVNYYPICVASVALIAMGAYLFIRTVSILEGYSRLARNEHM
ncbi:hypothetical protein C7Y44_10040 [Paenibacillus popilliae]|uniref:Uncharacterized protein n=1 Tax=Paenibacillus popilliae TaxID=78057 RepID=A0ABY3AVM3_PAEPP|nr:hypothetical protein C7Y44_10040 [Paenibacillus sp. SDF0028]